ncbi:uncharacterized protein LOC129584953 [Paramacrobiotus metropolitanus]|uniref:uncharacterized protein LOC129584953 n=1 Tax=Paramacrobiotus metropolitanus TaxID=2943436 RepID=UPI002445EF00|nr:uncharacterized protein LOC129584953 [Paramacrobiotus metropolitanus]
MSYRKSVNADWSYRSRSTNLLSKQKQCKTSTCTKSSSNTLERPLLTGCDRCRNKAAILNCEDCQRAFCAVCFGNAHLDPKKGKHKVHNIYSESGLESTRPRRPAQSNSACTEEKRSERVPKLKETGDEEALQRSRVTFWKNPFGEAGSAAAACQSDAAAHQSAKFRCELLDTSVSSVVEESCTQTEFIQKPAATFPLTNGNLIKQEDRCRLRYDINGDLSGLERTNIRLSEYVASVCRSEPVQVDVRFECPHTEPDNLRSGTISPVELEPKGKDIEKTAEVHRRNISRLLKFAGLKAAGTFDEKSRSKSLSPINALPGPILSKSSDNKHLTATTPRVASPGTSRTLHTGNASRPAESMQIHRPLGVSLATRMLDIDHLPRICITSTSNVDSLYNPRRTPSPAVSAPSSKPALHIYPRSRSPSPLRAPPSSGACAVEHSRVAPPSAIMAVLSRNEPMKKSPSLSLTGYSLRPTEVPTGSRLRSASFGREVTTGVPHKSPSPVRSRVGSTASVKKTLPVPYAAPATRRKSPVIGGNRLSISPASRRPSLTPSTGSAVSESEPRDHNSRYERNLKKFYSWCQHCKRILRAQQQDPVKGLLGGSGAGSKRISNSSAARRLTTATPSVAAHTNTTTTPATASSSTVIKKEKKSSTSGLFSFDSSDLPLKATTMGLLHPHCCNNNTAAPEKNSDVRPKSATVPTSGSAQPIPIEKPKFQSLFNFDDALSLTPDQVDTTWMYDPLDSDDDFCYTLDVETMSVCSDTSIVASAITCDTKLKDDDEEFSKAPLRKSYSSNK